jgi:hypothetical protein
MQDFPSLLPWRVSDEPVEDEQKENTTKEDDDIGNEFSQPKFNVVPH